jgi:hypothetical protein
MRDVSKDQTEMCYAIKVLCIFRFVNSIYIYLYLGSRIEGLLPKLIEVPRGAGQIATAGLIAIDHWPD